MNRRVMIVDDSPSLRRMLSQTLLADGFEVIEAHDGGTALESLKKCQVDMLVTDLNMPGISGIELVRTVRQMPGTRFLPIILITSEDDGDKRSVGKQAGVSGWISKPFQPERLLKVTKMVLGHA